MVRSNRDLLLGWLVIIVGSLSIAAQNPQIPAVPVPVAPGPQDQVPPPPPYNPAPAAPPGEWQPAPAVAVPVPAPGIIAQPIPQTQIFPECIPTPPPYSAPNPNTPGFYGLLELGILFPAITGSLSGTVTVGGVNNTLTLASADFHVAGSPRILVGYRLPDEIGAIAFTYRSIVSEGSANLANFDIKGSGFLHSRLNFNQFDLDYASPVWQVFPLWEVAGWIGIRTTFAYFDNEVTGGFAQDHATSNFGGAGPHAAIEVGRVLPFIPGLAATAKVDGGGVFGEMSQSFAESFQVPGGPIGGANRVSGGRVLENVLFDIGLSYTPPGSVRWARFGFGYQFEYWWNFGTLGASRNDFYTNGLYFRGEFNF